MPNFIKIGGGQEHFGLFLVDFIWNDPNTFHNIFNDFIFCQVSIRHDNIFPCFSATGNPADVAVAQRHPQKCGLLGGARD